MDMGGGGEDWCFWQGIQSLKGQRHEWGGEALTPWDRKTKALVEWAETTFYMKTLPCYCPPLYHYLVRSLQNLYLHLGLRRKSNLPKVTQPVSGTASVQTQENCPQEQVSERSSAPLHRVSWDRRDVPSPGPLVSRPASAIHMWTYPEQCCFLISIRTLLWVLTHSGALFWLFVTWIKKSEKCHT